MDPSGSAATTNPQSWNRYSYVENDPVNLTDRTGLQADQCADPEEAKYIPFCVQRSNDARFVFFLWYSHAPDPEYPFDAHYHGTYYWDPGIPKGGGGSGPPPECDMKNDGNARVISFLRANRDAAATLSTETGLNANFILAWAGQESGWGTGSAATKNNNFFGLTTNNWPGAVACPANAFAGFACFPVPEDGRSLLASGQSALSSAGGRYLTPALAAQGNGGTAADIARAIANAGFNSEFGDQGVTYGNRIQDTFNSIARRLKCLD